jgi:hypothetical protein
VPVGRLAHFLIRVGLRSRPSDRAFMEGGRASGLEHTVAVKETRQRTTALMMRSRVCHCLRSRAAWCTRGWARRVRKEALKQAQALDQHSATLTTIRKLVGYTEDAAETLTFSRVDADPKSTPTRGASGAARSPSLPARHEFGLQCSLSTLPPRVLHAETILVQLSPDNNVDDGLLPAPPVHLASDASASKAMTLSLSSRISCEPCTPMFMLCTSDRTPPCPPSGSFTVACISTKLRQEAAEAAPQQIRRGRARGRYKKQGCVHNAPESM